MVNNNKVTSFVNALNGLVDGKEDTTNKTTSLSSSSTNTQYPSAKAVYDALQSIDDGMDVEDFYIDTSTDEIVIVTGSGSGGGSSVTIADNLTTNDSSQALSAKQGKILNDKIGDILTFFNGSGN